MQERTGAGLDIHAPSTSTLMYFAVSIFFRVCLYRYLHFAAKVHCTAERTARRHITSHEEGTAGGGGDVAAGDIAGTVVVRCCRALPPTYGAARSKGTAGGVHKTVRISTAELNMPARPKPDSLRFPDGVWTNLFHLLVVVHAMVVVVGVVWRSTCFVWVHAVVCGRGCGWLASTGRMEE